jgi:ADP-ribose pyrophosphatase
MGRQRAISPWVLELVAGLIDTDEPPEQVAARESEEEAGVMVEQLEPICEYFSSPGGSNEYFYLFAGKADLSAAGGVYGLATEGEDIRVHVLPVEQLWHKLQRGEINNAHTLIAAQWLQLHHARLKASWLG